MRLFSALVVTLALLPAVPARADSIRITSGVWQWTGTEGAGTLTLSGANFTFSGRTGSSGLFSPYFACNFAECHPGTTVDLLSRWVGLDVWGTATVNGTTFSVGSLESTFGSLATEWRGSLLIPASFTAGPLSTPFAFSGLLVYPDTPTPGIRISLFGTGTATVAFAPSQAFPGAVQLTDARYEFSDTAPTPEPASMLLIGTGLAGVLAARRRRRAQA